jgi:predicted metalloendopeptidase
MVSCLALLPVTKLTGPGRLREWWTNSTVKAFEERAQCIARQYSKYYVLDAEGNKVYVNGNVSVPDTSE